MQLSFVLKWHSEIYYKLTKNKQQQTSVIWYSKTKKKYLEIYEGTSKENRDMATIKRKW